MRVLYVIIIKIFRAILFLLAFILLFLGSLYLIPSKYRFPEKKPFLGNLFYNPYDKTDSSSWLPANFHMHTHAWGGVTDGAENRDHIVWDVYSHIGFKSIAISNYQNINKYNASESFYIPAYEHGYGFFKNHHLCLGATSVDWFDLPYGQSIHHKQYILNRLRKTTGLISINHPSFFGGYKPEDFEKLTGYDFIEVLNGFRNSVPHWDSALSAGRPAFILANDDMHNISDLREIARRFTLINSESNDRMAIFNALKSGSAIGVYYKTPENQSLNAKKEIIKKLPVLESLTVKNDTLFIKMDSTALEIRFFGQGGRLLHKQARTRSAEYPVKPEDTYVRVVVLFSTPEEPEGLQYFLNPVFRTLDGQKPLMPAAIVDQSATLIYRIATLSAVFIFIVLLWIIIRRRRLLNRRNKEIRITKYR